MGNNMNEIMFTPMNGRRSLMNKKRRRSLQEIFYPCNRKVPEFTAEMAKIALESIKIFIKLQQNLDFDFKPNIYKFEKNKMSLSILNHLIQGAQQILKN
jgi:hypothetical protein